MAGMAHLGVALAAQKLSPGIPLPITILAAYANDVVWAVLWAAGLEHLPQKGKDATNPWSHGLFMALVWTALGGVITQFWTHNIKATLFITALILSHWLIDFLVKPMSGVFPQDVGVPLLFYKSRKIGLGLWRSRTLANIGEYSAVALGGLIYFFF